MKAQREAGIKSPCAGANKADTQGLFDMTDNGGGGNDTNND